MPNLLIDSNSWNGVSAGQTATLNLPVGPVVYRKLYLEYQTTAAGGATVAAMKADIDEVRLKVNDKVQRVFSATELLALNALHGYPESDFAGSATAVGILPIFFAEPWRRNAQSEDALAWGMGDVQTFQVEVDLASGATGPTLRAAAAIDRINRPMGQICKWRRSVQPVSATGIITNTSLQRNDAYYAVHAFSSDIDAVDVKLDQLSVYTASEQRNLVELRSAKKVPQSGVFSIVFDRTNRAHDALAMVRADGRPVSELRLDWTMAAASSFTVIQQTLGPRD